MTQAMEALWQTFRTLQMQSRNSRPLNDPPVAAAYGDWLAAYLAELAESETPRPSNIIQFPGARQ
jgi:hypothetical protein